MYSPDPLRLHQRQPPGVASLRRARSVPVSLLVVVLLAAVGTSDGSYAQCRPTESLHEKRTPLHTSDTPIFNSLSWPPRLGLSREDVTWPYARGRAVLSTVLPIVVGGPLLRVRPGNRTMNTLGLSLGSAGLLLGPSMGQWCLGGRYARKSILHTTARLAGAGGVALAVEWSERALENASFFALPFVAVSIGVVIGVTSAILLDTVLWTLAETPRRACNSGQKQRVSAVTTTSTATEESGVGVSIQF